MHHNNFIKQFCWFSGQNWKYSQCSRRRIGKEFAKSFKPEKIRISTREINRSFNFAQSHSSWTHRNCDVSLFQSWFSRTMDTCPNTNSPFRRFWILAVRVYPMFFSWELNIPKLLVVEEVEGANFHGFIFLWAREDEIFVNFKLGNHKDDCKQEFKQT